MIFIIIARDGDWEEKVDAAGVNISMWVFLAFFRRWWIVCCVERYVSCSNPFAEEYFAWCLAFEHSPWMFTTSISALLQLLFARLAISLYASTVWIVLRSPHVIGDLTMKGYRDLASRCWYLSLIGSWENGVSTAWLETLRNMEAVLSIELVGSESMSVKKSGTK